MVAVAVAVTVAVTLGGGEGYGTGCRKDTIPPNHRALSCQSVPKYLEWEGERTHPLAPHVCVCVVRMHVLVAWVTVCSGSGRGAEGRGGLGNGAGPLAVGEFLVQARRKPLPSVVPAGGACFFILSLLRTPWHCMACGCRHPHGRGCVCPVGGGVGPRAAVRWSLRLVG